MASEEHVPRLWRSKASPCAVFLETVMQHRQRLIPQLRMKLWMVSLSRSRALGPVPTPSARELWPFFVRFSAPRPDFAPRANRGAAAESWLSRVFPCYLTANLYICLHLAAVADFLPALGSAGKTPRADSRAGDHR